MIDGTLVTIVHTGLSGRDPGPDPLDARPLEDLS